MFRRHLPGAAAAYAGLRRGRRRGLAVLCAVPGGGLQRGHCHLSCCAAADAGLPAVCHPVPRAGHLIFAVRASSRWCPAPASTTPPITFCRATASRWPTADSRPSRSRWRWRWASRWCRSAAAAAEPPGPPARKGAANQMTIRKLSDCGRKAGSLPAGAAGPAGLVRHSGKRGRVRCRLPAAAAVDGAGQRRAAAAGYCGAAAHQPLGG